MWAQVQQTGEGKVQRRGSPRPWRRGAALDMLKIDAKEILVEPKTENTFDADLWKSVNFVTNALDNVKARRYVDSRCVLFGKGLLESGTLGTTCNSESLPIHFKLDDLPTSQHDPYDITCCTLLQS